MQVWLSTIPKDATHFIMDENGASSRVVSGTVCMVMHGDIASLELICLYLQSTRGNLMCFSLFTNYLLFYLILQTFPLSLK